MNNNIHEVVLNNFAMACFLLDTNEGLIRIQYSKDQFLKFNHYYQQLYLLRGVTNIDAFIFLS